MYDDLGEKLDRRITVGPPPPLSTTVPPPPFSTETLNYPANPINISLGVTPRDATWALCRILQAQAQGQPVILILREEGYYKVAVVGLGQVHTFLTALRAYAKAVSIIENHLYLSEDDAPLQEPIVLVQQPDGQFTATKASDL